YALVLLRREDDYRARSGYRIGVSLGFAGWLLQLVLHRPDAVGLVVAALLVVIGLLAIEALWRVYAREPVWLLRACAVALPVIAATVALLGARPRHQLRVALAVDAVLIVAGAFLLAWIGREGRGVASPGHA